MLIESKLKDVTCYKVARSVGSLHIWNVRFYFAKGALIDTGPPNMQQTVLDVVEKIKPKAVLITHHHEDHAGNASAISSRLGIPVFASAGTVRYLSDSYYQARFQKITWGSFKPLTAIPMDNLHLKGIYFKAIPVPGHSDDMTAWYVPEQGWLFSGDLYIADKIKIFRYDENLLQTIKSLQRVLELDFDSLLCGHNPKFEGGKNRIRAKLDFLMHLVNAAGSSYLRGEPIEDIAQRLLGKNRLVRYFTGGLVSEVHLVRSAIQSYFAMDSGGLDYSGFLEKPGPPGC
ncbi:MAG: MBL fold metallo-hydrolase [Deltaproteobacteria bacterium]|nr:MBL fold metallo-hydrolase [Deltaproteobacteria bacterium]